MSLLRIVQCAAAAALTCVSLSLAADPATAPAAPPPPESPNIHGFFELPFKTAYITPRGLAVENQGLVMQPIGGLVIPIDDTFTLVGGVWNSINTNQDDDEVGAYNEIDPFISLSAKLNDFELSVTYVAFISPPNAFETEHNIEFGLKYSDKWIDGFAFNPYVKFFWAVAGDSTVVLGSEGDTFDVEIGVVPAFTVAKDSDYPITFTFPTWITVGPEDFWGGDQNVGVFSTGVSAQIPLTFIPARYGNWHASAGVQYYYLINDNLVEAADILGSGDDRDHLVGTVSVGMSF